MYVKRQFNIVFLYFFTWRMILASFLTGVFALYLYQYVGWKWVAIPWLPVSLIGTAVAFYVGFKNSQSYDRGWEARKIWGGITNLSRIFGATTRAYINNDFASSPVPQHQLDSEIKILLYRHIAWLYALKHAMGQQTSWEHDGHANRAHRKRFDSSERSFDEELALYLNKEEINWLKTKRNMAVHLLDRQAQHLAQLRRDGLTEDFRHTELQKIVAELYHEQGRSERIKNTPLPRQYATSSTIFIIIFALLLPFGMIGEFLKLGEGLLWLLIPFNMIVTWVFTLMEYTGDISENPFEGLINDIPLKSIVRNIEIDLLDMLGEKDLPEKIKPKMGVLL